MTKALFKSRGIVLFVGSAISQWSPTSIPIGSKLSAEIASILSGLFSTQKRVRKAEEYIKNIPFEYLCERCPNPKKLRRLLPSIFYPAKYNKVHQVITRLIRNGIVGFLITTNYDTCLELAIGAGKLNVITRRRDIKAIDKRKKILFKIHGSASPGLENTMVYRLSREGELPKWKSELLQRSIAGRTLLVMGYSGSDFEITPQLALTKPLGTYWITRHNPNRQPIHITNNANQVLDINNGVYLKGDLLQFLEHSGANLTKLPLTHNLSLSRLINQHFSREELLLWVCNVLVTPGYASYVEELSKVLQSRATTKLKLAKATSMLAEGLFSAGKYKTVASLYLKAANIFFSSKRIGDFYRSQIKAVDSLRCHGSLPQARQVLLNTKGAILNSKSRNKELILSKIDLQQCLILREEYQRAKFLKPFGRIFIGRRSSQIQDDFIKIAKRIAPVFAKRGEWHDFQQLNMWASRMHVDFNDIYYGTLKPPIDLIGWKRLGHKIQEMMATRDELVRLKRQAKVSKKEILRLIETAEDMGSNPEVWKLILTYSQYNNLSMILTKPVWLRAFLECEYTLVMRVLKLVFINYR